MPIDQVSRLAMQRPFKRLYDPIVVEKEGKYFGIVTIKDMLDAYAKLLAYPIF
jgi:CBS domain-containing protein